MRYLWVEDFDGAKGTWKKTKDNFAKYFQISGKYINIKTLEDALIFLDEPENWYKFDAVLLDIRFRISSNSIEEDIFNKYFKTFLTREKFDEFASDIQNDPDSASSGILLYLALIYRYNYSMENIVFISANIDKNSDELHVITEIKEILSKGLHTDNPIDEFEISEISKKNGILYEKYCNIKYGVSDDDKYLDEYLEKIPRTNNINFKDGDEIEGFYKKLESIEHELQKKIATDNKQNAKSDNNVKNLKYNSIKEEFETIGLCLPKAFEKPINFSEELKSWSFIKWEKDFLNNNRYNQIRSVILPLCIELKKFIEKNDCEYLNDDIWQTLVNKKNDETEDDNYYCNKLLSGTIDNIISLFPKNLSADNSNNFFFKRVIKEIVSLSDNIDIKENPNTNRVILKLTRNWSFHQGINDVSYFDVLFIFHTFLGTFFNLTNFPDIRSLDNKLLESITNSKPQYDINKLYTSIDKIEKYYKDECLEAVNAYNTSKKSSNLNNNATRGYKKPSENSDFYKFITSIGHELSPKRDSVSMNHIYAIIAVSLKSKDFSEWNDLECIILKKLNDVLFPSSEIHTK